MSEQNKVAFRAIVDIFNTGDVSQAEKLVAPDMVEHDAPPGIEQGLAGFKQLLAMYRGAFSDLRGDVHQVIAEGDLVAGRITTRGRHTGELMGIPATGKNVDIQEYHIARFKDGKVVEHWGLVDMMTMMQQLGVVPQ